MTLMKVLLGFLSAAPIWIAMALCGYIKANDPPWKVVVFGVAVAITTTICQLWPRRDRNS